LAERREQDAILVRRCQEGDPGALRQLYEAHATGLLRFLERLLGDAGLAEDYCQEAFLRIWRKAELFDPRRGAFSAWLYRAAANLAYNRLALRSSSETNLETTGEIGDSRDPQPVDTVSGDERADLLHSALSRLSPRDRVILTLRHIEERPVAEVAEILEIPEGTVKSRVHYALRRLRVLLEERLGTSEGALG
jgi:RNA polymerase sigma-70 factor (ECF subfamily)